jgi:DNA-binding response OmpR family regulator
VATVLIAEDNADLRELCRTHLEADGFAVLEATTGTEALEIARRERPAVVLLDVVMPGLVFISGRGRCEEQLEGLERGAVDYVTKPFDPARLVARVRSLLDPGSD